MHYYICTYSIYTRQHRVSASVLFAVACIILIFHRETGTIEAAQTLHDHTIEENHTKNEVDHTQTANPLNAPDRFYHIRKYSMALYYCWQVVCVLIFIFTAYETLQTV